MELAAWARTVLPVAVPVWICAASLAAVLLTVYDKYAAKRRPRRRVRERTLLVWGILGGAVAELLVMRLIRHKTRHKKFMIGLPLAAAVHVLLLSAAIWVWRDVLWI